MLLHVRLTALSDAAPADVELLLDAAFGADRRTRTAYRLRAGATALPGLSFAAWDGASLVGTLQSWPVTLRGADGDDALVMVGPVAVSPGAQGKGVGTALMDALIAASSADDAMMMIGDPDYYGRWGFTADTTQGWRIDAPYERHRLLARLRRDVAATGDLAPSAIPAFAGTAN